jgi:vancomycin resistance protein VanJ
MTTAAALEQVTSETAIPSGPVSRRPASRAHTGILVTVALTVAAALAWHQHIPDWYGIGSGIDSVLPWLGVAVPILALVAIAARCRVGLAAAMIPALTWVGMFSPDLVRQAPGGPHDLRVASLNVGVDNPDPVRAVAAVAATGADVVVLEELSPRNAAAGRRTLDRDYPYHVVAGTVGLWSRLPLSQTAPTDIGIGWTRALRTTVTTAHGGVTVYAAHLASARPAATAERDHTLQTLAATVAADPSNRLVVAGDLNTAATDRRLDAFAGLRDTQTQAGHGFGFTWPSAFPLTRPDHILQRGMTTRQSWVVAAPGSDHRVVVADIDTIAS